MKLMNKILVISAFGLLPILQGCTYALTLASFPIEDEDMPIAGSKIVTTDFSGRDVPCTDPWK